MRSAAARSCGTLRVQPGDAERIREVLEEWASAEVSFNYVFEES